MEKIRKFIIPLALAGALTFIPKVFRNQTPKKKKIIKDFKKRYGIDEDNLFI